MKQRFSLRPMRSLVCFFALASGVVGLSGCASYYYGDRAQASSSVSVRPQGQPRTQLLLANYHAVDVLLQGVQLDPHRSVLVTELKLRENVSLQPYQGELLLSRELSEVSKEHDAQAVVVGTYAVSAQTVYISLKLVNPVGNTTLAASDYELELDDNMRSLLFEH